MPDSRRIVMSLQAGPDQGLQLWLADLEAGTRHALTSGTTGSHGAAVSPDGQRMIVAEDSGSYDVITMDLTTAAARTLISTARNELMPAWAAADQALVYVTDRSGPPAIWLRRGDNPDRPVVTFRDFPAGSTQWFMGPAISPRGDRVVYTRIEAGTSARLWISAVSGGTPIQLTDDTANEVPWFVVAGWRVVRLSRVERRSGAADEGQDVRPGIPCGAQGRRRPFRRAIVVSGQRLDPQRPGPGVAGRQNKLAHSAIARLRISPSRPTANCCMACGRRRPGSCSSRSMSRPALKRSSGRPPAISRPAATSRPRFGSASRPTARVSSTAAASSRRTCGCSRGSARSRAFCSVWASDGRSDADRPATRTRG